MTACKDGPISPFLFLSGQLRIRTADHRDRWDRIRRPDAGADRDIPPEAEGRSNATFLAADG